jgi:FkbM family methyltransferase
MAAAADIIKTVAYAAIDLVSGGRGVSRRICGEVVRFPVRWSRYYQCDYEPDSFLFLRTACLPGQTALDIGAHLGLFSVLLSRLVGSQGRVFSFEPTSSTFDVLKDTLSLNGCENVETLQAAVSNYVGTATFFEMTTPGCNSNSLVPNAGLPRSVEVTTVDAIRERCGRPIDLLKIDAEGAEFSILEGATGILRSDRPQMLLALHPRQLRDLGQSLAVVWDLLAAYDFSVIYRQTRVQKDWFVQQGGLFDVQVIPAERTFQLRACQPQPNVY